MILRSGSPAAFCLVYHAPGVLVKQEDPGRLETARALLAVIPDMVFRVSGDGTFLDFLPARGLEPYVPPSNFLGKKIPEVLPSFGHEALRLVREALDTGEEQRLEYTLPVAKGGEERRFEARLVACGDEEVVVLVRDVTEQKRREDKQLELERRVQHTQKLESLGVLAGGIAHDFNNLLTGILGNANLARRQSTDAAISDRLQKIERAAERAAELTNQMLAYAGKGTFVVGPLSLNQMVDELLPLLESSVSKKAELRCDLAETLPDVGADRSQLEQVLMNLVTNASDALNEAPGEIRIATRDGESGVVLEVSDTGVGMDDATRSRMFEPFYSTKFTGRGLGLAAVEGIARGHGASIEVETSPGGGTRFTLHFPPLRGEAIASASPTEEEAPLRRAATVLVIDDEEAVRDLAKTALEGVGYSVILARDGIEGLELLGSGVDVVILDLSMPRQGGEETLARIRERSPELPVLLTSGYSEQDARARAAASVSGFIHKPFRPDEIIAKVDRTAAASDR